MLSSPEPILSMQQAAQTTGFYTRKNLLLMFLIAVASSSLFFFMFPPGYYNRYANLASIVLALALIPLAFRPQWYALGVNLTTLNVLVLVTYIALESGGVNSVAVVWLNVLAVPVLLLLGPAATVAWIGLVLLTILGLLSVTLMGWVGSHAHVTQQAVPWALMNHAMALGNMMLAIFLYEHLHQRQLMQMDERNAEIKATHLALLRAQAHKDEFVAAVGHELRTPMNAILGFNGVLREELTDQPEEVLVVDHIRRSTQHLLQVVNDILDFSQLQAGKLMLRPVDFDLQNLMHEALVVHSDKAEQKGLTWTGEIDPKLPARVHADGQRLLQILRNLLDNALKFTQQGAVRLRISQRGERLHFEVTDTGRGIGRLQQAHIFNRFEQADLQTTRAFGGTGLGLSICEKLVSLQGGQIGVKSQEAEGACFWFDVPLQAAQSQIQEDDTDKQPSLDEALRILVVDDNAMNLMVAKLQLQKCWPNAQIVTANSAAEALTLLDGQDFDVALVDMVMPDMDGLQLTAHIHQHDPVKASRMPIIALTANTNPVDRQRCLDVGMDDVLDKPMDLDNLVRCVNLHIRKRSP